MDEDDIFDDEMLENIEINQKLVYQAKSQGFPEKATIDDINIFLNKGPYRNNNFPETLDLESLNQEWISVSDEWIDIAQIMLAAIERLLMNELMNELIN